MPSGHGSPCAASISVERAPVSPFPGRISGVAPWTGPVTAFRGTRKAERAVPDVSVTPPSSTGEFGAGGTSQEATTEPGSLDPRYRDAFDACMRARGY